MTHEIQTPSIAVVHTQSAEPTRPVMPKRPGTLRGRSVFDLSDWRTYFVRVTQLVSSALLFRELLAGSPIGLLGVTVITVSTFIADTWLRQNRALEAWQTYSHRCERQIEAFSSNNTSLQTRVEELQGEVSTMRAHIEALTTLEEASTLHVAQLDALKESIREQNRVYEAANSEYSELLRRHDTAQTNLESLLERLAEAETRLRDTQRALQDVSIPFQERVQQLGRLTDRLENVSSTKS